MLFQRESKFIVRTIEKFIRSEYFRFEILGPDCSQPLEAKALRASMTASKDRHLAVKHNEGGEKAQNDTFGGHLYNDPALSVHCCFAWIHGLI